MLAERDLFIHGKIKKPIKTCNWILILKVNESIIWFRCDFRQLRTKINKIFLSDIIFKIKVIVHLVQNVQKSESFLIFKIEAVKIARSNK